MREESENLSETPAVVSVPLLSQRRFTIYAAFSGIVLVGLSVILFLFVCAWEMKLESDHLGEWEKEARQVRPHYTWQFVTPRRLSSES